MIIVYTLIVFGLDARKAARNFEKHGVSFEEAATVFAGPDALEWGDLEHSHQESRFKRLEAVAQPWTSQRNDYG
jgi:uncharacterized DUF497 family protein